jgi:hypothetical protein
MAWADTRRWLIETIRGSYLVSVFLFLWLNKEILGDVQRNKSN